MSKKLITATILLLTLMNPAVNAISLDKGLFEWLGINYEDDIEIIVNSSGYGYKDLGNWIGVPGTAKVTGQIKSPPNGTWDICVTVNGNSVFEISGINTTQKFYREFPVKALSNNGIEVHAWWSEKTNTILTVHVKGTI